MYDKMMAEIEIKYLREKAEDLGISLQECLLLEILRRLDNLHVTSYSSD